MKEKKESSGSKILVGFLGMFAAWLLYYQLSKLEAGGGTMSLNVIFAVLYKLFGKNVATGVLAVLGILITVSGIIDLRKNKKQKEIETTSEKKEKNDLLIIAGIIIFCGVVILFQGLSEFELSGDSTKLYPIFITINKVLGKYVSCGILLLLGVFLIVLGKKKQSKLELIEDEENVPHFVSFNGDERFELIRTWSDEEINYFENLNLEIKEAQVYKHFWVDNLIYENENDENWLNISRYFWKSNELFYNTFLPENFKNYEQLKFMFQNEDTAGNIKMEKVAGLAEKYHFEVENGIISIGELAERGLIVYLIIEDLTVVGFNGLKYYGDELFFSIVNPRIKCRNNELYVGEEKISIETGYAIGAIELTRTVPAKLLHGKFENKILSEDSKVLHSNPKKSEFGINKKRTVEATLIGDTIITEERTITTYENYIPDVKSKELYFQTIILLMNFMKQNDKSIAIEKNKFYVLALENVTEMPALDGNLEELIFEYAEKCKGEFTAVEIGYLFRNSVNVLKGKFAIHPNIPKLYYALFDFFDYRTSGHENYFYGLWE